MSYEIYKTEKSENNEMKKWTQLYIFDKTLKYLNLKTSE